MGTGLSELIRWRLYERTGGGLMAELGSHQLDACSIFLGKVHPLAVQGVSTHSFFGRPGDSPFRNNREIADHVFVTFEFPGKTHPHGPNQGTDKHDVVVMAYSSVSTNGFEAYGECLQGSRGTLMGAGAVADACRAARDDACRPNIDYQGEYRVDWTSSIAAGAENPVIHSAFGYAAQLVVADRESGAIEKVVAVHDVGLAVNPLLCAGQVEGAVHMGLGYALTWTQGSACLQEI